MEKNYNKIEKTYKPLNTLTFQQNFEEKYSKFFNIKELSEILRRSSAVLSGGSVLSAYANFISSDFDFYVNSKKLPQLFEGIYKSRLWEIEDIHMAPAYDDSFIRKNNILVRVSLVEKQDHLYRPFRIDIMVVPDNIPVESIVTNFDLSFCEIWYDGVMVYATDPEGVLNKTGYLKDSYMSSVLTDFNMFIIKRMHKYKNRGFSIILKKPKSLTVFKIKSKNFNEEEFVVKKILDGFLNLLRFQSLGHLFELSRICELISKINMKTFTILGLSRYILNITGTSHDMDALIIDSLLFLGMDYYIDKNHQPRPKFQKQINVFNKYLNFDFVKLLIEEDKGTLKYTAFPVENIFRHLSSNIDNDEGKYPNTCYDLFDIEEVEISEYLKDPEHFIFIVKYDDNINHDKILCYTKSYITSLIQNRDSNLFYDCKDVNFKEPYLKVSLGEINGLIKLSTINYFLYETNLSKRILYIIRETDNYGQPKTLAKTCSFGACRSRTPNYVSAYHCQEGSSFDVYTIKFCGNNKECILSNKYNSFQK